MARPKRPPRLGPRGKRFWDYAADTFEMTPEELELLGEVCRTMDTLELLDVATQRAETVDDALRFQREARQQRLTLGRQIGQLALPNEDGDALLTAAQRQAQKAGRARWHTHAGNPGRLRAVDDGA